MSVKNPQLAGYLLTQNRSNFLYVEGSTAWLYECQHQISHLYIDEQCYDKIPIHYKDTIKFVDPITRQTFDYATPIPCENNPQIPIALDPDTDDYYYLTPRPMKCKAPLLFEPQQIQTSISPNTFTAQEAGIYSQQELRNFWDRVLFAKHSDNTLQLLGKAISYDFMRKTETLPINSNSPNPYNTLRIGLSDYMLNIAPFLDAEWFKTTFLELFGYPTYIITQCGIYFSAFLFIQFIFKTIIGIYNTFNAKKLLKGQISFITAFTHGFFNIITESVINAADSDNSDNSDSDDNNIYSKPKKPKKSLYLKPKHKKS